MIYIHIFSRTAISLRYTIFEVKKTQWNILLAPTSFNTLHVSAYVGVHDHLYTDLRLLLHAVAEKENPSHALIFACCFGGLGHGRIILVCLVATLM